ncbi:MAG: hypothetical protein QGH60_13635 [Phycisphaerae bacterium]|jgi:hypothetical protein|nr:hypothetical protein [Phycisphaerae bacterium]
MKRAWIGIALLSTSWVLGLNFYHVARWIPWVIALAMAIPLLASVIRPAPPRYVALAAAAMLLPMIVVAPWPYRAGPILTVLGLVLLAAPIPRQWAKRLGSGLLVAGVVLLAQSVAMICYESFTARFPDLPSPLSKLLGALGGLVGIDVANHGPDLSMFTMRQIHRLGATWALLLDPISWCFLVGGAVLVLLKAGEGEISAPVIARRLGRFVVPVILWLPIRSILLMAVYLHRALRTDYDDPLSALVDQFWNPWVSMALLVGPVLLAWRFACGGPDQEPISNTPAATPPSAPWKPYVPVAMALVALVVFVFAIAWEPVGQRQQGRVLMVDYHDQRPWPSKTFDTVRTDQPFTTKTYGQAAAYNHSCLYDYCSRFYTMSRQTKRITEADLAGTDVLVLKVPSEAYSPTEIKLVMDFVQRGGGLLLLGEHTSVYGSGPYLNVLAEKFGFRFRYDCAFGVDSVFDQLYEPPLLPHPIVQHLPPMDFATSCTIDSGATGQAVIQAAGLKNLNANYHVSNFYPQTADQPQMRYGAFVQLLTTRHGQGRVAAFTDSTIFSNFCVFEPGKTEIMLGMMEWLNHRGGRMLNAPLAIAAFIILIASIVLACRWRANWMLLLGAGALGWALSVPLVRAVNRVSMPAPQPNSPMVRVGIDRTVCDAKLPKNGFIAGRMTDFGQFERSILRLGYFTFRAAGDELSDANVIIFLKPNLTISQEFKDQLKRYVAGGGKLLVMDSPENAKSTASRLVHQFGLKFRRPYRPLVGKLTVSPGWPAPTVKSSLEVSGGEPFVHLNGTSVGARAKYGKGEVWAIGFATRFTDNQMGFIADVTPKGELLPVFEYVFTLLRQVAEGKKPATTTAPATTPAPTSQPARS